MQESRRASKRKSVHGSDIEPSSKKQRLLHHSLPPAPDKSPAHATTYQRPAEETPQLVYASLSSAQAQAQAHDGTNFRPSTEERKVCHQSFAPAQSHDMANHALATQKLDIDHGSLPSALTPASAQAHDITDLGPATKKPKLSYASLPRTRVRASSVERAHLEAEHMRKSLRLWCRTRGHDFNLVDQRGLSDTALLSPNFDVCKLMAVFQSSTDRHCAYGPPELDSCPFDGSSAEKRSAENPKVDAHCVPEQELHDLSDLPSAPGIAAQTCPVSCEVSLHHPPAQCSTSRGRPESGEETSDSSIIPKTTAKESPAFGDNVDAACAPLDDQASTPLSPINSTLNVGYNTRLASPDQIASAGSNPDMGDNTTAASSDQIASAGSNPDMGDNTTAASSDQIASAGSNPDMGDNTTAASSDQIAYLALNPDMRDNTTLASSDQIASADSNRKMGDNNTAASSDQIPSVASNRDKRDSTKAGSSYRIASVASSPDMRDDTTAAISDQNALPFPDSSLRDDTTLASPSEAPPFGPVRNQGGRPRGRKPRVLKTPKGPTRFQKNHPVKATLNIDVWENILLFCSPDFLLKARTISTTFRSILKNDSLIWKRARVNHFGPDMPDPPSGLSEQQYADLLTGNGCQTLGCESSKARKTYWAVQRRLCLECFHKAFLPVSTLISIQVVHFHRTDVHLA